MIEFLIQQINNSRQDLSRRINTVHASIWDIIFLKRLKLDFRCKKKEISYQKEYKKWVKDQSRIAYYLAIVVIILQGIVDLNFQLATTIQLWQLRSILLIISLLGIMVSYSSWLYKYQQVALASSCFLSGCSLIIMLTIIPKDMIAVYYSGLILIFIWALFVGLSCRMIIAIGLGIIAVFNMTTLKIIGVSTDILISHNCFLVGSLIFTAATSLSLEKARRMAFLEKLRVLQISKNNKAIALRDNLTRLPNRLSFEKTLNQLLKKTKNHTTIGVLFIDLDNFKPINDQYGHAMGDKVLRSVADRLAKIAEKKHTVARIGGDEFIMLTQAQNITEIRLLAEKIILSLDKPIMIKQAHKTQTMRIGASIGISTRTSQFKSTEKMIREADLAMYDAKSLGKNRYSLFQHNLASIA